MSTIFPDPCSGATRRSSCDAIGLRIVAIGLNQGGPRLRLYSSPSQRWNLLHRSSRIARNPLWKRSRVKHSALRRRQHEMLLREPKRRDARFVPEGTAVGMWHDEISNVPLSAVLQMQDCAGARRKNGSRGPSLPLVWRRYLAVIRSGITELVGARTADRLIGCQRTLTGKRMK